MKCKHCGFDPAEVASVEEIEKICFDHISLGTSEYYKMLPSNLAHALVGKIGQREMNREEMAEKVYNAISSMPHDLLGCEFKKLMNYEKEKWFKIADVLLQAKVSNGL